ncbi:phenylalanine--tRNA ligase subunit beta, partial [Patescibacteria group bacterium]|nr:phenylalanine--tRNA ligase subunit beta [Patescibacteria group bacterium]
KLFWHKGRSAEILCKNKLLGRIGEINPSVLNTFGIESRVGYFEFDLENLFALCNDNRKYKQINKFPEIKLDLSVVFDEGIKWADIERVVMKTDNILIKSVESFDIYRGKNLGENKKSIAFRITYQAENRTLKDEEVDIIQNKIIKILEKSGGEIRK